MIHSNHIMLYALTMFSTLELYHKRGILKHEKEHKTDTLARLCLLCDFKYDRAMLLAKKFKHEYGCDISRMYDYCESNNDKVLEFLA